MNNDILLKCLGCKRQMSYSRDIDPDIPTEVVRIESSSCDRCDSGGFGEEHWFDINGKEIIPDWAVDND